MFVLRACGDFASTNQRRKKACSILYMFSLGSAVRILTSCRYTESQYLTKHLRPTKPGSLRKKHSYYLRWSEFALL